MNRKNCAGETVILFGGANGPSRLPLAVLGGPSRRVCPCIKSDKSRTNKIDADFWFASLTKDVDYFLLEFERRDFKKVLR